MSTPSQYTQGCLRKLLTSGSVIVPGLTARSAPARTYRPLDSTDTAVAAFGEVEFELQPAGRRQDEGGKTLAVPARKAGDAGRTKYGASIDQKEFVVMRIITCTTLVIALSTLPVLAQDNAKPSASTAQHKNVEQSNPDSRTVGRDWKVKQNADQHTDGKARGMSPDSADHYNQKVDRDWRAEPRNGDKSGE
jgi:hypothetical protein